MMVSVFSPADIPEAVRLWNRCCEQGEIPYKPMTEAEFNRTFLQNQHYAEEYMLAAKDIDGKLLGFVSGIVKRQYLRGEHFDNTPGYLTMLMTLPEVRNKGIGSELLRNLENRFRTAGKRRIAITYRNPVNLTWLIPGTDGHDHNNAPGVDMDSAAFRLFTGRGYIVSSVEYGMYLPLRDFALGDDYRAKEAKLQGFGITVEFYDADKHHGFDEMFDKLGGEVWRATIAQNQAKTRPLPVLVALDHGKIVGFAGPIDRQESGRGWFNGIATHPDYGRKGIAFVLFHRLMSEFKNIGAQFSTLFTDDQNPAARLYESVGFRTVKKWAVMTKEL